MIQIKYINPVLDILYKELLNWGVRKENIIIDEKDGATLVRKIISIKKETVSLRIVLEVMLESNDFYFLGEKTATTSWHPNDLIWKIRTAYFMENSDNIEMTLEKRSLVDKFRQLLKTDKTKIYNKKFDQTFSIWCNHDYAYAQILSLPIQAKILNQAQYCSEYSILKDRIRYTTIFEPHLFKSNKKYFSNLLDIGFLLVQNIENWGMQKQVE